MTAAAMHKRNAKGESQPTDPVTAAVPRCEIIPFGVNSAKNAFEVKRDEKRKNAESPDITGNNCAVGQTKVRA
jgi:hypothetical protein